MILYLGNMLSGSTGSVSVIEILAPRLATRYDIQCASPKRSQIPRLWDMLSTVYKNRHKVSLVIIDSYSTNAFWYTILSSLLCRQFKIPYIPVLHGGNFPARIKKSKFWSKQVFNNSFANIAPSGYLLHHFKSEGFNAVFIPNMVDIKGHGFKLRDSARPRILWVRAFHLIYNPLLAIDAITLLCDEFPDIELCMVGADKDGTLEKFRDHAEEKGVKDKIKIMGRLSQEGWSSLSDDYDIFLNTTNVDNTPLSVIEAMALGIPVVTTNAGGLPYLVEEGKDGLLVPAGDAEKMAQAIKKILNDPALCRTLSQNGRKKAEGFSWDAIKDQWFEVIDKAKNDR
jgi:L-malate glycosyltransferase